MKKSGSILLHLLLMAVLSCIFVALLIWGLNIYTRHQSKVYIPSVRGRSLEEADRILKQADLRFLVVDSIYPEDSARYALGTPGAVYEIQPIEGSTVKPGRLVFLKVFSYHQRGRVLPSVQGHSEREARALLLSAGFKYVTSEVVPGDHVGLAVGVRSTSGEALPAGRLLSPTTRLVLLVEGAIQDSLSIDSLIEPTLDLGGADYYTPDTTASGSAVEPRPVTPDTTKRAEDPNSWW